MERRVKLLNISADEVDRRQSAARKLNRNARNRLRQQQEQFRDNHELVATEIDQEMKKIQNELNGIREITGHDVDGLELTETSKTTCKANSTKRKRKQRTLRQRKSNGILKRFNRDDSLVNHKVKFNGEENSSVLMSLTSTGGGDNLSRNVQNRNANGNISQVTSTGRKMGFAVTRNDEKLPEITINTTSNASSLLDLDLDEARAQTRKRLLGESEVEEGEESGQSSASTDDKEVEQYMYVPPDGRKRTVYLMPPLKELLKEARKARYLRMPKRLSDDGTDPERELSIDEIFNKSA